MKGESDQGKEIFLCINFLSRFQLVWQIFEAASMKNIPDMRGSDQAWTVMADWRVDAKTNSSCCLAFTRSGQLPGVWIYS